LTSDDAGALTAARELSTETLSERALAGGDLTSATSSGRILAEETDRREDRHVVGATLRDLFLCSVR
jgi:hypothetical protein